MDELNEVPGLDRDKICDDCNVLTEHICFKVLQSISGNYELIYACNNCFRKNKN